MKSTLLIGLLLFVATLLVRLPASWITPLLPAQVECPDVGGTAWSGYCNTLLVYGTRLRAVSWQVHPAELLAARLSVSARSADPDAPARADITLRPNGEISLRDLTATLPTTLTAALFPSGWSGALSLDIQAATLRAHRVRALLGVLTLTQLHSSQPPIDLGSFELRFPASSADAQTGDELQGALRDLGGPLAVSGRVLIKAPGDAYEINGTATARSGADANLTRMLDVFLPADAQGQHPFSLAGTF